MTRGFVLSVEMPETSDSHGRVIKRGQRVRSYDFPWLYKDKEGETACYIEGEVLGVEQESFEWGTLWNTRISRSHR